MQYKNEEEVTGIGESVLEKDWRMVGMLVIGVVMLGEGCVLFERPGPGLGLYLAALAGVVYLSKKRRPGGLVEYLMTGMLVVGALQMIRWTSLSNVWVMATSLVCLVGMTNYRELPGSWAQCLEGILVFIRPFGVLKQVKELTRGSEGPGSASRKRIGRTLRVILPAIILLIVFGFLLSTGNAVMGKWVEGWLSQLDRLLGQVALPGPGRIVMWAMLAWLGLLLVYAARPSRIGVLLSGDWKGLGRNDILIRGYQWFAVLVAMNAVFLMSSVTDVVYLWFSRELPEGISHSRYLHQGVYVLILTTLLSALILGTLTQHDRQIRASRYLRILAQLWIVQNLVLISGVFLRLGIYVEAYGYTPRRIYVLLFLLLVVVGFILLSWAVARLRTMKWLIEANLVLLYGFFSILQLFDVPGWVTELNLELYRKGEIGYPEPLYLEQIGSHAVSFLMEIQGEPQDPEDCQKAAEDLQRLEAEMYRIENRPWQSFQYRDYVNWKAWKQFKDKDGSDSDQTSPD